MMKSYDAYLFDWDGTLGRTLELWLDVMHRQFKRYGIEGLTDDQIVQSLGRLIHVDKDFGIPSDKLNDFMADVQKDSTEKSRGVALYDGAIDMLDGLKNSGKKLALITTNWRQSVDIMLAGNELEDMFDVIISGDAVRTHKPDPEGVFAALKALNVSPDEAVMLGDSSHDLGAAQNAGIDSILFYPPSHQLFYRMDELMTHKPTYVIDGWDKLIVEKSLEA